MPTTAKDRLGRTRPAARVGFHAPWWASVMALAFMAGCAVSSGEGDPQPADVPRVDGAGKVERWGCGDYFNGCGFRGCPVKLTADFSNGSGTVEFAGTVERTAFKVRGIERRWDWCLEGDGRYGCAFVIDADGDGQYYDFGNAVPDSDGRIRTKPSELFKCTRRRARN